MQYLTLLVIGIAWPVIFFLVPVNNPSYIIFKPNPTTLNVVQAYDVSLNPYHDNMVIEAKRIKIVHSNENLIGWKKQEASYDVMVIVNMVPWKPSSPRPAFFKGENITIPMFTIRKENEANLNGFNVTNVVEISNEIESRHHHLISGYNLKIDRKFLLSQNFCSTVKVHCKL